MFRENSEFDPLHHHNALPAVDLDSRPLRTPARLYRDQVLPLMEKLSFGQLKGPCTPEEREPWGGEYGYERNGEMEISSWIWDVRKVR